MEGGDASEEEASSGPAVGLYPKIVMVELSFKVDSRNQTIVGWKHHAL